MKNEFGSIREMLLHRAEANPDGCAYIHLDREMREERIHYRALYRRGEVLAGALRQKGIQEGERCLLLFPQGIEFIVAFAACNLAGLIPVPLDMPHPGSDPGKWERIAGETGARAILTAGKTAGFLKEAFKDLPALSATEVLSETGLPDGEAVSVGTHENKIAFLQYTSGSTGNPEGVIVTQESVTENIRRIRDILGIDDRSRYVMWLPYYHDFGLIVILLTLYAGGTLVVQNPEDFVKSPILWAQAITKYRSTHTAAPNFALQLLGKVLVEQREQCKGTVSFESLEAIFLGGEPNDVRTAAAFYEAEKMYGAKAFNIYPGYGLAEATLLVSTYPKGSGHATWVRVDKHELRENRVKVLESGLLSEVDAGRFRESPDGSCYVGNGYQIPGHRIEIRDPETFQPLGPDCVGEICFSGASLSGGYWGRPEKTGEVFCVLDDGARVLKTGDIGFLNQNGELFITGRKKEMLIIHGRNYYPHDIENAVTQLEGAFFAGGIAVVPRGGAGQLAVIQEIREGSGDARIKEWSRHIRRAAAEACGVSVDRIVFVPQYAIPRTPNGKIQRLAAAGIDAADGWVGALGISDLQAGMVPPDALHTATEYRAWLREMLSDVLGVDQLDADKPFTEIGMDSAIYLSVLDRLTRATGLQIGTEAMFNYNSVNKLADYLFAEKNRAASAHGKE
ncbi:MAG: AMP-binding protein [Clostridiales Family XIII bacterium]|jgi:acyl-CoA synthetase (AMP-forming)/AMP-acid ligase II/acyl carrier protein|nr:AMP-binding protein [Clostridiales Family XIII bacterium]